MKAYKVRLHEQLDMVHRVRDANIDTYAMEVNSGCGPTIVVDNKECINFISNNYLGFSLHPKVIEAVLRAARQYGVGIGGSPIACGTTNLHIELQEKLACFYGKQASLLFPSGYQALAGTIQGLMKHGDIALLDRLDHRSIIDGCALAGCKIRTFKHNRMDDLAELVNRTSSCQGQRLLVVDSVYSMDGDIALLRQIAEICNKAHVTVMIDEAHSLGVIGKTGKGLLEYWESPNGADVISGTFSKFAGAVGGFTVGDRDLIEYLQHYSSPHVFSASLPPLIVAAVLASFDLLETEPEWRERLWNNFHFLINGFKELGFDTGNACTPCIPIMVRNTEKVLRMNKTLLELGVYTSPIVHPGVAINTERLRLGVMATHTREHLERALDVFARVGREYSLIS